MMGKVEDLDIASKALTVEELHKFDSLAAEAWDKPWWRQYMKVIKDRRLGQLAILVDGFSDQRSEDRLRGQINELNFIIAIDSYMQQIHNDRIEDVEKEKERTNLNEKIEENAHERGL